MARSSATTARSDIETDDALLRPGGALSSVDLGDDIESRIYRAVFESVMNQRLTPGTKLPEAQLCELFGASRGTVRKVLQRLAHDHIVQLRPNRGAIIAVPSPEEIRQIFEARRGLEAIIVNLATHNAKAADIADLRQQLKAEHDAMHRFEQPAWARLASGFHLRLAALSRNPILERYLVEMVSRCSLIVALYEPPGNASCEHDEHERIVDCMAKGDASGAVQLMDEHLRQLERNVSLKRSEPERTLAHLLGMA
ncbi:MAG TPA: GntR family transcriptional regulator [Variovorax sp.]|nr:GntR family transcriptional regulator [Variovorax sp.]